MTSSFPVYSAEENITRIQMERNVRFVVVEGIDDLPIYDSTIRSMLPDADLPLWDIVHVGGKNNIKQLIRECSHANFICLADKDFDEIIQDKNVVNLSRYSIENFLICEEAISAALSIALKVKFKDVLAQFDLEEFHAEVKNNAEKLLKALFYYHRVLSKNMIGTKPSWSDKNILLHPPSWGICSAQVERLISQLIPESISMEVVENYFNDNFTTSEKLSYDFPGKMLRVLLQRHVDRYFKSIKSKGSPFSTPDSFSACVSGFLNKSNSFTKQIEPVLKFLMSSAA